MPLKRMKRSLWLALTPTQKKRKIYIRAWSKAHPDKRWLTATPEYKAERMRQHNIWRKNNPESVRKSSLKDYNKNREKRTAATRAWQKRNPDKVQAIAQRVRYGPNALAHYATQKKKQNNRCAVCGKRPKRNKRLGQDHDHTCCPSSTKTCGACLRGLLCDPCNMNVGHVEKYTKKVAPYLKYWRRK